MVSASLTCNTHSLSPSSGVISPRRCITAGSISFHRLRLNSAAPSRRLYLHGGGEPPVSASRSWGRNGGFVGDYYRGVDDVEDEEDEEEEDRSLDLLVKFVENVFRKISKRARKAVRSVLPLTISTQLVGFSVNGVIILTFLWVLKAFLEVVCTLGTVVFVSILVIRGVWTGISFLQENRNHRGDELDDRVWRGMQPVT